MLGIKYCPGVEIWTLPKYCAFEYKPRCSKNRVDGQTGLYDGHLADGGQALLQVDDGQLYFMCCITKVQRIPGFTEISDMYSHLGIIACDL